MTVVSDFRAILMTEEHPERAWNATHALGTPVILSYSFTGYGDLPDVASFPRTVDRFVSFTESQRSAFRDALTKVENVAGVTFVEAPRDGMLQINGAYGTEFSGIAQRPGVELWRTDDVILMLSFDRYAEVTGWLYEVALHEIGHTLGLKHPHEDEPLLRGDLDRTQNTLMSYNEGALRYTDYRPMDVEALQYLYGKPVHTSDWVLRMGAKGLVALGGGDDDVLFGIAEKNSLSGRGGDDTLIGRYFNDTLKGGNGADLLEGGHSRDRLFGGNGNDSLYGGGSSDFLDGGRGNDFLRANGRDSFGVNNTLVGGSGNDTLQGGPENDILSGGRGDDRLQGGRGRDLVKGGFGDDRLDASSGSDTLNGGSGSDTMIGGQQPDRFEFTSFRVGDRDTIREFQTRRDKLILSEKLDPEDAAFRRMNDNEDTLVEFAFRGGTVELLFEDIGRFRLMSAWDDMIG